MYHSVQLSLSLLLLFIWSAKVAAFNALNAAPRLRIGSKELLRTPSMFLKPSFEPQLGFSSSNIVSSSLSSSITEVGPYRKAQHSNSRWLKMSVVEPPSTVTTGAYSSSAAVRNVFSEPLPSHPQLVQGKLENGFSYVILQNSVPAGRFEAHLEVLSGSANELDRQQGMAHLLEHVAYMGSPKRQLISGTGSRTNAYTDFHHTVFFAACPVETPDHFWKKPMLPMALDALLDVMTTNIDDVRLEKERAAVLSEASMVNKMEYRVECQILSSLHKENRIAYRFPIGKEELIKQWTKEDLQLYHNLHYRPDNVILFVVGDVDVATTVETIQQKFGHLKPQLDASKLLRESGEYPAVSMRDVSRHFPPVVHEWSCRQQQLAALVPEELIYAEDTSTVPTISQRSSSGAGVATDGVANSIKPVSKVFKHELLQSFSFHLFAKRPIEPITTREALKRDLLRRMTLSALQIRLNVQQRQDPLFTFIDFNQLNWPREGCAVCSLDMTTDIQSWRDAVTMAVAEIRRLGLFGLTKGELSRYTQSIMSEIAQAAAQVDQMSNEDVLNELMEAEACGHTYMHPIERNALAMDILEHITLEDANAIARELCEHLSHMEPSLGVKPAAVVACAPMLDRDGAAFAVSDEDIAAAIHNAMLLPLEPLEDTPIPSTLITVQQLQEKKLLTAPAFVAPLQVTAKELAAGKALGVVQRQLNNGMKVNMKRVDTEPQRANLRLYIPGGRMLESKNALGSVLLASRTIQEGGAFLNVSREAVELFCIDHLVMVDIIATEEALILDFQSVTTPGPTAATTTTTTAGEEAAVVTTGIEAVMQVAHIILTDFLYEEDAFVRAKQSFHEQFDCIVKGLESACLESLTYSLTAGDGRYLTPNHKQIDNLDLDTVRTAITSQFNPAGIEVTMSGDLTIEAMETLILDYLGTVPAKSTTTTAATADGSTTSTTSAAAVDATVNTAVESLPCSILGKSQQLGVYLPDSDERAMGYLAGKSPNRWGVWSDGSTVADVLRATAAKKRTAAAAADSSSAATAAGGGAAKKPSKRGSLAKIGGLLNSVKNAAEGGAAAAAGVVSSSSEDDAHRDHPLFGFVALAILQEVANRRLFSVVREERQLTYDASFQLPLHESIRGGWYLVSVTSSPQQVQSAVRACKEALASLRGTFGVMGDSLQSAKRTILNKFRSESSTNRFWIEHMTATQLSTVPQKQLSSLAEFDKVLQSVTSRDIELLVEAFNFVEDEMTVCVGVTAPEVPLEMRQKTPQ